MIFINKKTEDFMNKYQQYKWAIQVIKDNINENKETEDFMKRYRQNNQVVYKLLYKIMVAVSLLSPKEYEEYDLENYNNLLDISQKELIET
ncbi:19453_t:CDS:2 [Funneliformis geosporum]|uniref:19453_t:CDS:1 n=1 Tax=Funneliformis geosporum TaxID=1117311 RepID=A0A9W4WWI0_9GLOM|nr:19453_t:CDS:2 [Funneliformis geosporum]